MTAYLFPNLDKKNCYEYTIEACSVLKKSSVRLIMDECYREQFRALDSVTFLPGAQCIPECDVVIVIGGDGTILKCAEAAAAGRKPILGINCGRLGFMASLEYEDLHLLSELPKGRYNVIPRMMLKVTLDGRSYTLLNDVVISKADDCKIADFKVMKDGRTLSYLRADGVIFSTATGSTAYSMSAGGPIIEPDMQCIEFTQICAHSLFARTMILSHTSDIKVILHCKPGCHAHVNVDGNIIGRISEGAEISVCKSELMLDIIDIKGGSFFNSVNEKLMQPLKGMSGDSIV